MISIVETNVGPRSSQAHGLWQRLALLGKWHVLPLGSLVDRGNCILCIAVGAISEF